MTKKDEAAEALIAWHFQIEPELREVVRFMSGNEEDEAEPIKLLEINSLTPASGSVDLFSFAPSKETPFRTVIAEITPDEYEVLKGAGGEGGETLKLPDGWTFDGAVIKRRPDSP
jgi:hypothetical protein